MKKVILIICFVSFGLLQAQKKLPNINLKTLEGKETNTLNLANEQELIVINLWATWCVPCKNELDAISEVYSDWQDETNIKLFAISIDDARTVKRVKPLINGKDWEFEILLDTNNDLKRALGAATVPLTLIVKNGEIVYRHSGYTPGSEDDIFEAIKKHS